MRAGKHQYPYLEPCSPVLKPQPGLPNLSQSLTPARGFPFPDRSAPVQPHAGPAYAQAHLRAAQHITAIT